MKIFRSLDLASAVDLQNFSVVCKGLASFFTDIALDFHLNGSPFKA